MAGELRIIVHRLAEIDGSADLALPHRLDEALQVPGEGDTPAGTAEVCKRALDGLHLDHNVCG